MKATNDLEKYVKHRLLIWAEWYARGCDSGLGYPRRNILGRIRDEGGLLVNARGSNCLPVNLEAEEIETVVNHLGEQSPKSAKALRICYFYPLDHEATALRDGYTRSCYYSYLKLAHEWIKGYLSARHYAGR